MKCSIRKYSIDGPLRKLNLKFIFEEITYFVQICNFFGPIKFGSRSRMVRASDFELGGLGSNPLEGKWLFFSFSKFLGQLTSRVTFEAFLIFWKPKVMNFLITLLKNRFYDFRFLYFDFILLKGPPIEYFLFIDFGTSK